jgi:hypothetical protein
LVREVALERTVGEDDRLGGGDWSNEGTATMSSFPGSPRLLKGAVIGLDPFNPLASVIIFQYDPDTLMRSPQAQLRE